MADRYLAALAPVLASVVLGKPVIAEIRAIERLFGQTWLEDQAPFEPAFAKWREFRDTYVPAVLGGMTVNERLYVLSLTDDYDRALASRDTAAIRKILETACVDEPSIVKILSRVSDEN